MQLSYYCYSPFFPWGETVGWRLGERGVGGKAPLDPLVVRLWNGIRRMKS